MCLDLLNVHPRVTKVAVIIAGIVFYGSAVEPTVDPIIIHNICDWSASSLSLYVSLSCGSCSSTISSQTIVVSTLVDVSSFCLLRPPEAPAGSGQQTGKGHHPQHQAGKVINKCNQSCDPGSTNKQVCSRQTGNYLSKKIMIN